MNIVVLVIAVVCFCLPLQANTIDFLSEMGKGTVCWDYIKTKEDHENITFYQSVFDKNYIDISDYGYEELSSIPKTLHFIWLGPKELSEQAKTNISDWIKKHPSWRVKLWTDKDRQCVMPGVEQVLFREYPFNELSEKYYEADNYGEKAQILKYEILFHEGGVYLDHDVVCIQPLDVLLRHYDFFAGLEPLATTYISTSIYLSHSVLGSKPSHPILLESMKSLVAGWEFVTFSLPGAREEHVVSRSKHRSCMPLDEGFKKAQGVNGNRDIIFPSSYFSQKASTIPYFASHAHIGTWHKKAYPLEKKLERYSAEIRQKNGIIKNLLYAITVAQLVLISLLAFVWKYMNKRERRKV